MNNKLEYRLPETLRRLMRKHPLTGGETSKKDLAECVGISRQTLSKYINSEVVPNAPDCLEIAGFFGVTADFLLTGCEDGARYPCMEVTKQCGIYEKLNDIAVLCANAESLAHCLMESVGKSDV